MTFHVEQDDDDDPDIATDADDEAASCSCSPDGLHSLGSVASVRNGDTDPDCPLHGRP